MKKSVAIIGCGPSSLMLAATLDTKKFDVTIYERQFAPGRKFLIAGKGGFNLTHSEGLTSFISRYTPVSFLANAIRNFSNEDLQIFLNKIGIQTYTGTSKRIFPVKGTKPIAVLNAFLNKLHEKNITIQTQWEWYGWNTEGHLLFKTKQQSAIIKADIIVFALGGSSWKITGSDGQWLTYFQNKGIATIPFQPSNCSYKVEWKNSFLDLAEGKSLKNISVKCNSLEKKGELLITRFGLEGSAIYALSPEIRKILTSSKDATIHIDLKPAYTYETILNRVKQKSNKSLNKILDAELNIQPLQIALLKTILTKEEYTNPVVLAAKIKQLPIQLTDFAPIDEAISTVGGIDLNEINDHFELTKLPSHFAIGEMLNWDAPTGGYLLQACFSMGYNLGDYLNKR